jgi:hypothetical protein
MLVLLVVRDYKYSGELTPSGMMFIPSFMKVCQFRSFIEELGYRCMDNTMTLIEL